MEKLTTAYQKVAWILDRVPAAKHNYKLLILLYWQVFDDIKIPEEVIKEIAENGTEPETISRAKRKVMEVNLNINNIIEKIRGVIKDGKGNNKSKD